MVSMKLIDEWLKEDVPYFDLTTELLGTGEAAGSIAYFSRSPVTVSCVDEAAALLTRCGLTVTERAVSGQTLLSGETVIAAEGRTAGIHKAWRVTLSLLEYACGISTRTAALVAAAREAAPDIAVLTTRKIFPGTKAVSIAAVIAGGALPHRLGLGETVLIFDKHLEKIDGGYSGLAKRMPALRRQACGKEICVEVSAPEEALLMTRAGADALQFDKVPQEKLTEIVTSVRAAALERGREIRLIAAGGVNAENAGAYARTGVDAISTTWPYFGKPADMTVRIT
ncbi:MAG: ModD protein [Clostridiales Family XIII bacterium]|jgi:molybdenum transport protein|nr:ModD protein [Clostridiales Family XIII bacterium]